MSRMRVAGFAGLLIIAALVGGTIIGSAAAATGSSGTARAGVTAAGPAAAGLRAAWAAAARSAAASGSGTAAGPAGGNLPPTAIGPKPTSTGQYCAEFRHAFAAQLGVDESELAPAAKQAAIATIDSAVADGRMTKAAGDRLKARIAAADADGCALLAGRIGAIQARLSALAGVIRDGLTAAAGALDMTRVRAWRTAAGRRLAQGRRRRQGRPLRASLRRRHRGSEVGPRLGRRRRNHPPAARRSDPRPAGAKPR